MYSSVSFHIQFIETIFSFEKLSPNTPRVNLDIWFPSNAFSLSSKHSKNIFPVITQHLPPPPTHPPSFLPYMPSISSSIYHTTPTRSTAPNITSFLSPITFQNDILSHALCDVLLSHFGQPTSIESTYNLFPSSPPMAHNPSMLDSSLVCVSPSLNIDSTILNQFIDTLARQFSLKDLS